MIPDEFFCLFLTRREENVFFYYVRVVIANLPKDGKTVVIFLLPTHLFL